MGNRLGGLIVSISAGGGAMVFRDGASKVHDDSSMKGGEGRASGVASDGEKSFEKVFSDSTYLDKVPCPDASMRHRR